MSQFPRIRITLWKILKLSSSFHLILIYNNLILYSSFISFIYIFTLPYTHNHPTIHHTLMLLIQLLHHILQKIKRNTYNFTYFFRSSKKPIIIILIKNTLKHKHMTTYYVCIQRTAAIECNRRNKKGFYVLNCIV